MGWSILLAVPVSLSLRLWELVPPYLLVLKNIAFDGETKRGP
jgi:hypothetical protein